MPLSSRQEVAHTLGNREQQLSKLTEHPGWSLLREDYLEAKQAYTNRLTNKILAGYRTEPIPQRELDWKAGFFAGIEWVLAAPEAARIDLEHALERLERNR